MILLPVLNITLLIVTSSLCKLSRQCVWVGTGWWCTGGVAVGGPGRGAGGRGHEDSDAADPFPYTPDVNGKGSAAID